MTREQISSPEFMHKPGEMFIANGVVHILKYVTHEETPADTDCEEYVANCGAGSQSWGMPAAGVEMADFVDSLDGALRKGAKTCGPCFNPEEAKPLK